MIVRLVYETEVEECDTSYDYLMEAVSEMKNNLKNADSVDDVADIFYEMRVGGSTAHPGFKSTKERFGEAIMIKRKTMAQLVEERGEFTQLEDGFWYYWPGFPEGDGCISSHELRSVADHLDKLNAPHQKRIDDYFDGVTG